MFSINSTSVKGRFFVSVVANTGKAGIGFFTGILIARSLGPVDYGDLFFLLGSFTAIRSLVDMGTSSAFYTFIAQRSRPRSFYLFYFAWLVFQFFLVIIFVIAILPSSIIDRIWLGQSREIILLAFVASFMQQQLWNTVVQVCESQRRTALVQLAGLFVVVLHLLVVILLIFIGYLSVIGVLLSLFGGYSLMGFIIWFLLQRTSKKLHVLSFDSTFKLKEICIEYWVYCKPMVTISLFSFLYEFSDRWLLQHFGGAEQQGFYQISARFASVSLLATASILRIFWKEIAEAYNRKDNERVAKLYSKVNRGLLMLGVVISAFLVPWSGQITQLLLGKAYADAWPVLAVMFLYPIHQSMGQINGTMFMACERTKPYMKISILGLFTSMPVTYFLLASPYEGVIPGLGLGALGLALKMVVLNVFFVNVQAWLLARYHNWKYEWFYQVEGLVVFISLGFIVKILLITVVGDKVFSGISPLEIVVVMLVSGILYLFLACLYVWYRPSLFGIERNDMVKVIGYFKK